MDPLGTGFAVVAVPDSNAMRPLRLALLLSLAVAAVPAMSQVFFARSGLNYQILKQKSVLKELKVEETKEKEIADLVAKIDEKMRIEVHGGDPEEIGQMIREQMDSAEKFGRAELQKVFTAEQYARFDELNWQSLSAEAFTVPSLRKRLNVTEAQLKVIDAENEKLHMLASDIYENSEHTVTDGQVSFQLSPSDKKKLQEAKDKALATILASLDDKQRAEWQKMLGVKFTFEDA